MKILFLLIVLTGFLVGAFPGCSLVGGGKKDDRLDSWILENQDSINVAADQIISDYKQRVKLSSGWISSSVAITKYADNHLGQLAQKANDSLDCIVVILEFFNDKNRKKRITFSPTDTSCINNISRLRLNTDSTKFFVYSKDNNVMY